MTGWLDCDHCVIIAEDAAEGIVTRRFWTWMSLVWLALAPSPGVAQGRAELGVELNKLEPAANGCRAYFVVSNGGAAPIRELRLDVFLFDKAGVVMRRVGMPFVDVRPERSKVFLFDLAEMGCGTIGRLLVNDVLACAGADAAAPPACQNLSATSRAVVDFVH